MRPGQIYPRNWRLQAPANSDHDPPQHEPLGVQPKGGGGSLRQFGGPHDLAELGRVPLELLE